MTNHKDEAATMPDESGWSLDDAISWAKNHTLYQLGLVGNNGSAHAVTMLINHAEATRQHPTPAQAQGESVMPCTAIEEFDRFCRFIDGLNMGGFVENDFMSKKVQKQIKADLSHAPEVVTVDVLRSEYAVQDDYDAITYIMKKYPNGLIIKRTE